MPAPGHFILLPLLLFQSGLRKTKLMLRHKRFADEVQRAAKGCNFLNDRKGITVAHVKRIAQRSASPIVPCYFGGCQLLVSGFTELPMQIHKQFIHVLPLFIISGMSLRFRGTEDCFSNKLFKRPLIRIRIIRKVLMKANVNAARKTEFQGILQAVPMGRLHFRQAFSLPLVQHCSKRLSGFRAALFARFKASICQLFFVRRKDFIQQFIGKHSFAHCF